MVQNHLLRHWYSSDKHTVFDTPGESIMFSLLQPGELVTKKALFDRVYVYCQQKKGDGEIPSNLEALEGFLDNLVKKDFLTWVRGERLSAFLTSTTA